MEPMINHNTIMLVDKVTPHFREIRKGEVVVLKSLHDSKEFICKRVVNVGDETLQLENREVFIPPGFVWAEGDNKDFSFDSRHYGPMSNYLVIGIVRGTIYPEFKLI